MADEQSPDPHSNLTSKIKLDVPHSARIWNYWMGGKDNYEVDRAAGDAFVAVYPDIVTMAKQSQGGAQSRFAWSEAVFEHRGRSDAMGWE